MLGMLELTQLVKRDEFKRCPRTAPPFTDVLPLYDRTDDDDDDDDVTTFHLHDHFDSDLRGNEFVDDPEWVSIGSIPSLTNEPRLNLINQLINFFFFFLPVSLFFFSLSSAIFSYAGRSSRNFSSDTAFPR